MTIRMTIVHSNDDVVEVDHATLGGAHADAVTRENERHGTPGAPLSHHFDWIAQNRMQFGTDYHYVVFEEVE